MRLLPTHYTIKAHISEQPKSWVLESSIDGVNWIEIDRQAGNRELAKVPFLASLPVSNSGECRFVRMSQTGVNQDGGDALLMRAFEFFGTLLE
jgi:hypothetical protein